MSNEYEKYEPQRRIVEKEANQFNIQPFSFENHKKSKDEKLVLKAAKKDFLKSQGNQVIFKEKRDEFIQTIIKSHIPNWGNIKIGFLNHANTY